jgi:hypothetical protein
MDGSEKLLGEVFKSVMNKEFYKKFKDMDSENIINLQEVLYIYPLLQKDEKVKVKIYRDILLEKELPLHKIIYGKILKNLGYLLNVIKKNNYEMVNKINDREEESILLLLILNQTLDNKISNSDLIFDQLNLIFLNRKKFNTLSDIFNNSLIKGKIIIFNKNIIL